MDTQSIIDILNDLLAVEQRRLSVRLAEAQLFVPRLAARDLEMIHRMADQSKEHGAWLVESVTKLGGVPGLRTGDVTTADLHYQEVRRILPRLLADHETLIQKYKSAAERVAAEPLAAEVVGRILARHQDDLEALKTLAGGIRAPG